MKNKSTPKPKAVLISDIHFTVKTLELASGALKMAQSKALELNVPLVIAGDTLDSKAIMRAECVNRLIKLFTEGKQPKTYMLVGNHDLLNEKGEEHSLEFLKPYVNIVDGKTIFHGSISNDYASEIGAYLLPYFSDHEVLKRRLSALKSRNPKGATIICHQGIQGASMGHYVQDKTSLPKEDFAHFRVISGHYHQRQDIKCGPPKKGAIGLFSYIGNPYTQNFGEANDPTKGFQILLDNGLLEFVPTNFRKHIIVDIRVDALVSIKKDWSVLPCDPVWLKLRGPKSFLDALNKDEITHGLFGCLNYKLNLIPDENEVKTKITSKNNIPNELLDSIIDNLSDTIEYKDVLKSLWRQILYG